MPTGYTAKVAEGTVTELEPFALQLARGMGALVVMRDEPWDAPIPDKLPYSDYYEKKLDECERELDRVEAMSTTDAALAQSEEIEKATEYRATYQQNMHDKEKRYTDMITKVKAWEGAPEGIKKFALDQLNESLKFDCGFNYVPSIPVRIAPEVYLANKVADARAEFFRAQTNLKEEVERVDQANLWIKQLKESLK